MARRVRDKAGLKDFRPIHGLRHVFASTLASNGVDLYTLQALLTHGSPAMTQRYAHLTNEHLRNAANIANRLGEKKEKYIVPDRRIRYFSTIAEKGS
ncbi:MAG: tyrosine-type recombinase/integrase [Desulfovibrio sp.]|nr:tyrosine-type recombinase/integrase [Desulfovibrio sp.]